MSFKNFFLGMPVAGRRSFAREAQTTVGYCNQICYGGKRVELGMADVFVALSKGHLTLADIPLTDRAVRQRQIRESTPTPAAA